MKLSSKAIEDLGLSVLGNCEGHYTKPDGSIMYPATYGQYSNTCEGCEGYAPKKSFRQKKCCGNCKHWTPSGDFE